MMIYRGEGFFSFFFFLPALPLHLSLSLSLPNFYSIRDSTRKLLSSPSNFFRKLEKANDTFESVETSGGLVGGFRAKKCEEWREQHHPGDDGSKVGCPADRKPIIHLNTKPERCTWLKLALFPFLSSPRFPPRLHLLRTVSPRSRFFRFSNDDFRFPFRVVFVQEYSRSLPLPPCYKHIMTNRTKRRIPTVTLSTLSPFTYRDRWIASNMVVVVVVVVD